ncbi:MAG: aspartate aminotransferase family protein [Candidatus Poribacteria bacterium]|nr:aspartate aminotransferase family protein [Candidatus Poribacteria bacterium]
MTTTELLVRRERLLGAGTPLFYQEPINIVRGEGVWLFDADGRRYVDMYNNVPCVGHCHPHVVEAMHRQAGTLNVHSRYLHEGILDYAERLTNLHADALTSAVFTCTGTEANEVAMSMARIATGGRGFICTDAAYHGNSAEVSKLTRAKDTDTEIRAIPYPQRYRPLQDGASESELVELYLAEVRAAIDGFEANGIPLAGMLVCPILANEGLPDIPAGFMPRAAEMVRDAGGLFIADEVQAGFCRTGRWWGYEVTGFVPDIVTMGKPMGNGMPLAGVVGGTELVDAFRQRKRYFNTFASSPLQAAVGMAVLDVIETENLRQNAADVGNYLRGELAKLQVRCEPMGDIRGHGLFIGLEWVSDRAAKIPDRDGAVVFVNRLKDKGFLIGNAGALGNVLKIRPPLVFQKEHANLFLTAFEEIVGEFYGKGS